MTQHNPGEQHPEEYRQDLNPNARAGENFGTEGEDPAKMLSLADIKEAHEQLPEFSAEELSRIPVLPEGARLEQGGVYMDLARDRVEFAATGDMQVGPTMWLVPKDLTDYTLWNRLRGVEEPARTAADPETGRSQ